MKALPGMSLKAYREEGDRAFLGVVLKEAGGNIAKAARLAGLSRTGLYRLMSKYGIEVAEKGAEPIVPVLGEPMVCEHANEASDICECDEECYCRKGLCYMRSAEARA